MQITLDSIDSTTRGWGWGGEQLLVINNNSFEKNVFVILNKNPKDKVPITRTTQIQTWVPE